VIALGVKNGNEKILAVSLGLAIAAPITAVDAYAKRGYRHHYRNSKRSSLMKSRYPPFAAT
jgi:hypothetical protein